MTFQPDPQMLPYRDSLDSRGSNAVIDYLKGIASNAKAYEDDSGYPLRAKDAKDILKLIKDNITCQASGVAEDPKTQRIKTEILPDHVDCAECGHRVYGTPYLEDNDVVVCLKCSTHSVIEIICIAVSSEKDN